jgi:hypothetical protein
MIATACFLLGLAAAASPDVPAAAAANLRFEVKDGTLWVRRGRVRAPLQVDEQHPDMAPDFPLNVRAKQDGAAWTLRVETNCQGIKTLSLSATALESRLERAAAGALARHHQWDAAAHGFARAVELDPAAAEAATDLAVAQVRGGHRPEAVATLLAAASRHHLWVVWRLAIDRDLAPVATDPALRALAAQQPGHATLRGLRRNGAAVSVGLIAWDRVLGNMMDESPTAPMELRIADATTGHLVARLRYRDDQLDAVDRGLAALGFELETVSRRPLDGPKSGARSATLEGLRVTVKEDGRVRLSQNGRVVGDARIGAPFDDGWAAWIRDGVLISTAVNIGDGCGAWAYDDYVWIPLPP